MGRNRQTTTIKKRQLSKTEEARFFIRSKMQSEKTERRGTYALSLSPFHTKKGQINKSKKDKKEIELKKKDKNDEKRRGK